MALVVIPLVPESIIGIDILSSWQHSHTGFLICRVRGYYVDKGQLEALKWKIVNLKQGHIPGEMQRQSQSQGLERCRGDNSPTSSCSSCSQLLQKTAGHWSMTVDLPRRWPHLQLLFQVVFHCLSKLARGVQLLTGGGKAFFTIPVNKYTKMAKEKSITPVTK